MPSRDDVIVAARQYLGVPFRHQGRIASGKLDCVGLLFAVAADIGKPQKDFTTYSRWADGHTLMQELDKRMPRVDERLPGRAIVFWLRNPKRPQHVGLLTDVGLLHTHAGVGKVVETSIDEKWRRRFVQAYELPGVD